MVDPNGPREELRLVAKPLIRYESVKRDILDGALFSFSVGTDPEAILVLEARVENGRAAWQYAFARYHFLDLTAFYKDDQVWHVDFIPGISTLKIRDASNRDGVYATYHTKKTLVAE